MLNEIYEEQKTQAEKSLEALKRDFTALRTGKINAHILDPIQVDYYGSATPPSQATTVLISSASTINTTPQEKLMPKATESAIMAANIGVNPNNDGESVKLFFPPMTEEQRGESVRHTKAMGREAKVSIRNGRKNTNDTIKKLEKDKAISEGKAKEAYDEVQELADLYTHKIDESVKNEETQPLKV